MLDFLKGYADSKSVRFHMPGHKGKTVLKEIGNYIPGIDITEIDGSDNLHSPDGIIMKSQRRASKLWGAKETVYLVNGSTSGIYSAITGAVSPKGKILLQRNSHGAAYNAIILGDLKAEYIYPEYSENLNLTTGVSPKAIEQKLKENPDIEAVFVTSPSYYGICLDIEKIAEVVHRRGIVLIVDEAHGSHLRFGEGFPKSALESGADIVIQSTHKTLLGFTQTAMIHIGTDKVDMEKIKKMAKIYQSTSPSYILMSSIDRTVTYMEEHGADEFRLYTDRLKSARAKIEEIPRVKLLGERSLSEGSFKFDMTKLVFEVEGISGNTVESELRKRGVELEMSDLYYGVALSSFMDSREDFENLEGAIRSISLNCGSESRRKTQVRSIVPEKKFEIRDSFYMEKEKTGLDDAVGKTSGDMITPYPPGIPLLVPGEIIDGEALDYIESLQRGGHTVQGISDGRIETIREDTN